MIHENDRFGTVAYRGYMRLVNEYGFNSEVATHFGKQQSLAATNASPEGYTCLFLGHSNWMDDHNDNVINTIMGDYKTITEKFINEERPCPDPEDDIRIVFAKNIRRFSGNYIFLGVYRTTYDPDARIRNYTRISNTYPMA